MLAVKNVTKSFGNIVALESVSFELADGEFVFITGQSGSGKTTLIRLLLRELLPDKGSIELDGVDTTSLKRKEIPSLRQKIGVVFQDFKVIPERTLRENVELALAVINLPKNEWDARVSHVLQLVGLKDRDDLFPQQLSGGELQRASLARALVINPKIILADEPTGNLDWETAEKIMELFEKINKEGKTILMATHNRLIVDKLKKREIELRQGKIGKDSKAGKIDIERKGEESKKIKNKD